MKHQEAFDLLNEQLKDIPKSQIRIMSLSVLPRLMDILDHKQETCPYCRNHSHQGESFVKDIRPLFEQNIQKTKSFEHWVDEAQKHLKTEHKLHVKGRIASTYTTIGMAIGAFIGFILAYFFDLNTVIGTISIGWAIGMILGYSSGKLRERKLHKNNHLY